MEANPCGCTPSFVAETEAEVVEKISPVHGNTAKLCRPLWFPSRRGSVSKSQVLSEILEAESCEYAAANGPHIGENLASWSLRRETLNSADQAIPINAGSRSRWG